MIHIYHGELVEQSRKELSNLKSKFNGNDVEVLEGKKLDMTTIIQAVQSHSLFGQMRLVVIENYLSRFSARKKEDVLIIESVIQAIPDEAEVVFWYDKELSKTVLNLFPSKTDRALFKPKRIIFQLVENIGPEPTKTFVELLTECVGGEGVELTYAMIVRQIRLLILVKSGQHVSEIAPWQKNRLERQAQLFTLTELHSFYSNLLLVEERVKSGKSAQPFAQELQLFLLSRK